MPTEEEFIHHRPPLQGGSFMNTTLKPERAGEHKMEINNINQVYGFIVSRRSLQDRFNMGMNSDVSVYRTGWLKKACTDNEVAEEHLFNEYSMYKSFHKAKMTGKLVPELDFGYGFPEMKSIVVSQINMAAPLWEYARAVLLGQMSEELWNKLMTQVGRNLKIFHNKCFAHCDLHGGNIILEVCENGRWKPFFIDFGMSKSLSSSSEGEQEMLIERDIEMLFDDLDDLRQEFINKNNLSLEVNNSYIEGLGAFLAEAK